MSSSSGKRQLDEDIADSVKKVKQSVSKNFEDNSNMASTSEKCDRTLDKDGDVSPGIKTLFANLSADIQSSHEKLSQRLDSLENDLKGKISELVTEAIKSEVAKLRDEYSSEIDSLKAKVTQLEKSYAEVVKNSGQVTKAAFEERKKRVVIRGLPGDNGESGQVTRDKVMSLIRDGCKLADVSVTHAERKSTRSKKPGPVIATVESFEKKQTLMKAKNSLRNIDQYKRVYIENEYAPEIRSVDNNIRTILKEIGKDKKYHVNVGKMFPVRQTNGDNGNGNGRRRE